MKLLHLADVHLGVKAVGFGDRADDLRRRIQAAFERALSVAGERACDVVLIAGDLFDSNRVGDRTLHAATKALADFLAAAPQAHVLLIPGNHDCLGDGSIYHAAEFTRLGERFHLFTEPAGETVRLDNPDAAIHAVPFMCNFKQLDINPLAALSPLPEAKHNIAMVHVGVTAPHWDAQDAPQVTCEEIAACGMDYVALGHFHNFTLEKTGSVVARYPGPPEVIGLGEAAGGAIVVELTEAGVATELVRVSSLELKQLQIMAAELDSEGALADKLLEHAGANVVLRAEIAGVLPLGVRLETDEVAEELSDRFYRLSLDDASAYGAVELDEGDYPERLVTGKFMRMMQERIEAARASGDERGARIGAEALNLGVHLLQGGDLQ